MTVEQRFKEYLDYKGLTVNSQVEKACGLSNGQINNGVNGSRFGSDKIENILNVYKDLSAEWLMRGKGSMIIGESKAVELENKISSMSEDQEDRERAYDILLGMFDVMKKTYEFYSEK